tara:strand:- start:196 stop:378 length:183 start_codon:yes stop_codon:yes gene_type:complete
LYGSLGLGGYTTTPFFTSFWMEGGENTQILLCGRIKYIPFSFWTESSSLGYGDRVAEDGQ